MNFLINGPSGTGKTTIGNELHKFGYEVINTDEAFGYFADLKTEEAVEYPGDGATKEWYEQNGWIWNRKKILDTLKSNTKDVFYCGGALKESEYYPLFDKVFRLVVEPDILVQRLKNRHDAHTSNDLFIKRMLVFLATAKEDALSRGLVVIDTSIASPQESAQEIVEYIK